MARVLGDDFINTWSMSQKVRHAEASTVFKIAALPGSVQHSQTSGLHMSENYRMKNIRKTINPKNIINEKLIL